MGRPVGRPELAGLAGHAPHDRREEQAHGARIVGLQLQADDLQPVGPFQAGCVDARGMKRKNGAGAGEVVTGNQTGYYNP